MNSLVSHYIQKIQDNNDNVFEMYSKFFKEDLSLINSWLEDQMKSKTTKNDLTSAGHRQEGNVYYARKELDSSLEFYTRSLCFATPYSKEYGLALANRSAVAFEMKEYESSLKDIAHCFKSGYPKELFPKIFVRKAECYFELKKEKEFIKAINEGLKFVKNENLEIPDKNKYITKFEQLRKLKIIPDKHPNNKGANEIPTFADGESKTLASASTKIKMSYSEAKGRHIVAATDIQRGDILFIEKAFVFAPVFRESQEFCVVKCYHCLAAALSSVPCSGCTVCVYCDEACRDASWAGCHRWECVGMQAGVWFHLGISFPALKVLLRGCQSRRPRVKDGVVAKARNLRSEIWASDLRRFGDRADNYRYVNRLVANVVGNPRVAFFVVMSAVVVTYLREFTDFFAWYLKQPQCPERGEAALAEHVGAVLTTHTAQLVANSSTVQHWMFSAAELLFPDDLTTVACGLFPSVSIMNHSCRPNVTNFFICDTIVVKALEDISANEEVFNCYGVDYRVIDKELRQQILLDSYRFHCMCPICSDPSKELDMLDCYLCFKCKGLIPDTPKSLGYCSKCGPEYSLDVLKAVKNQAQRLEVESSFLKPVDQLLILFKTEQIRQNVLYKYHKDFLDFYIKLYKFFCEHEDWKTLFHYFNLWLDVEKGRRGASARSVGTQLFIEVLTVLYCMHKREPINSLNSITVKEILRKVDDLIKEAKSILHLYYPDYIIRRLMSKIHFIVS